MDISDLDLTISLSRARGRDPFEELAPPNPSPFPHLREALYQKKIRIPHRPFPRSREGLTPS